MKAVITDYGFNSIELERKAIEGAGHSLDARTRTTAAELMELVADADCVITQFAPITADVIRGMRRARGIVRYGIGVDNVDLEAAKSAGIPVCNVPDYCIDEVADHTLAFALALTRCIVPNSNLVASGKWGLATPIESMSALKTMTVGVIGFGRIGREVARRFLAFKARVQVFDPIAPAAAVRDAGCEPVDLETLLRSSDLITLHCPSTAQTRGMINRDSLAKTKRGLLLVNVGRGDLVDPAALIEALGSGAIRGAALDVYSPEPIPKDSPILAMSNVVFSAHIASASPTAVEKLKSSAASTAVAALRGELPPNVVNGVRSPRFPA